MTQGMEHEGSERWERAVKWEMNGMEWEFARDSRELWTTRASLRFAIESIPNLD